MVRKIYSKIKGKIQSYINKRKWKIRNSHNQTWVGNIKNIECITVGKMSWGQINTIDYIPDDTEQCKILIGNFTSIASEVFFMRGGEHRIDRVSTFLYKNCYALGREDNLKRSKDIIVGDDVWIGYGTLILPGAIIGQGAVIGAGSVVRGYVPPYSVYVGDKVVKYRFSKEIISKMIKIDYSKVSKEFIESHLELFYQKVTLELATELEEKLGD